MMKMMMKIVVIVAPLIFTGSSGCRDSDSSASSYRLTTKDDHRIIINLCDRTSLA